MTLVIQKSPTKSLKQIVLEIIVNSTKSALLLATVLAAILVSSAPSYAKGKASALGEIWSWITGGDGFVSKDDFIDLVSDGQVLCYEPKADGSCSQAEIYPVIGKTFLTIQIHYLLEKGILFGSNRKLFWETNMLCEGAFDVTNWSAYNYRQPQNKMNPNADNIPYSSDELKKLTDRFNRNVDGHCFAYKHSKIEGSNEPALIQYEFVEGVEQKSVLLVQILPAGSKPVLY